MRCPVFFQFRDGEAAEQFLPAFEIGMEGGEQQAFAEAAGTAEEIVIACVCQPVNQCCFVYIQVSVVSDFLEVLDADGVFPDFHINCIK